MRDIVVDEYHEDDVNQHLRSILENQSVGAHQTTERNDLLTDSNAVVNTEAVEHSRNKHILADESNLTVSLDVG